MTGDRIAGRRDIDFSELLHVGSVGGASATSS